MAYENEKSFAESVLNFDKEVEKAQAYIKENFRIESEWNEEESKLNIWTNNVNESLQLAAAKEYLENTLDTNAVDIIYGKD
jgi:hypothetical protein